LPSLSTAHNLLLQRAAPKQTSDGEEENLSLSDDYNGSDQNSGDFEPATATRRASDPKVASVRRSGDFGHFKRSPDDSKALLSAKSHELSRRNSVVNARTSFPKIAVELRER
jgi:hypothetical protein